MAKILDLSIDAGYLSGCKTLKPMNFKTRGMLKLEKLIMEFNKVESYPWRRSILALLKQTRTRLKSSTSSQCSNNWVKFSRDKDDGISSFGKKIARHFFSGICAVHWSHTAKI